MPIIKISNLEILKRQFTKIARDSRVSYQSIGFLCRLLIDFAKKSEIEISELTKLYHEKELAILSLLKELEGLKYVRRTWIRSRGGKFKKRAYILLCDDTEAVNSLSSPNPSEDKPTLSKNKEGYLKFREKLKREGEWENFLGFVKRMTSSYKTPIVLIDEWLASADVQGWRYETLYAAYCGETPVGDSMTIELFNQWYPLARAQGLVKASMMEDGVLQVLTNEDTWVPFSEMLKKYPHYRVKDSESD